VPDGKLDALLEQLVQVARRSTGARSLSLAVHDEAAGLIRIRWSVDLEGAALEEFTEIMKRFGMSAEGLVLPAAEGVMIAASSSWVGPRSYARLADIEAATPRALSEACDRLLSVQAVRVVPLRVEDRNIGSAIYSFDRPVEAQLEELMTSFADQGALLVQNVMLTQTLERRVEERTREHREALAALGDKTRELERVNAELREVDRAKSNFLATVSHELRTPLVSIQGYNELMLREALGSITTEQRRGLTVAVRNLGLLVDLIDNLLYFAQREHEPQESPVATVDLVSVVDDAVELVRARASERGVKLVVQRPPDRVAVRANRYEIHRLVVNLLSNAIKFNRERDGAVRVAARARDGMAELAVADNGIGIAEAEQTRIFDRFYQVDGSRTRKYGGAGIGLAVALEIARAHGGVIALRSAPGQGSEFTVRLPLAAAPT